MKQLFLICLSAALLTVASCAKEELSPTDLALRFRIEGTRAAVNYPASDYFGVAGLGNATVVVKATTVCYTYDNGELAGLTDADCIYFPVDGQSLSSVKVRWPEDAIRTTQGAAVVKDQSIQATFLATDWLSAELKNLAPTQTIALTLEHERPKLTFTLTGAMAGKKLISLTIAGYKAYCDDDMQVKSAQLILLPGNADITTNTIGTLGIDGESAPRNFIIQTTPTLVAGQNHTIQINF